MRLRSTIARFALLSVLTVPGLAQGASFEAGELFLYSPGLQGPGYTGPGILRVNPQTGASSVLLQSAFAQSNTGTMAFDPYRQRVVVSANLSLQQPSRLWYVDGNGALEDPFPLAGSASFNCIAPAGNGRIYFQASFPGVNPFSYLDANDDLHTLFEADGVTPLFPSGALTDPRGAIYDPATNALFFAFQAQNPSDAGQHIRVRKVPLSADGSRVGGPMVDSVFSISSTLGAEQPMGWSHAPNGMLILSTITLEGGSLPRMLQVDPATAAITPWGNNGTSDPFAPTYLFDAGAYSTSLDKVVVLDAWNKVLRSYQQGSPGGLGTTVPVGPATFPNVGIQTNLVSVPSDGQASTGYCTAKTTTIPGCLASIKSFGVPQQSSPAGFHVIAAPAPGGNPGIVLWSLVGAAATPFAGGWLCVQTPLTRGAFLPGQGTTGACNGIFQVDGAYFGSDWQTGAQLFVQCWFRDPGNQLSSSLSDALTFTVQ
jgi:hypothetical protein